MQGELVSATTSDKVRLDGLFCEPIPGPKQLNCDAVLLVHGLGGNFYQSRLLKHFARSATQRSMTALLVNTRGHDYLNSTTRMGRSATLGAAVEVIDECRFDFEAWIEFLVERGHERVVLLGHSLGAIKALYSQAHQPHNSVCGIAAFSATKLSYDSLLGSTGGDRFSHWLAEARRHVADGNGDQFMHVDFPFPTWMSATAYLAKYGDGDRYNWMSFADRIQKPVLAAFGARELEENPAFAAMKNDIANLKIRNFTVTVVPNADHFYSACFDQAVSAFEQWCESL